MLSHYYHSKNGLLFFSYYKLVSGNSVEVNHTFKEVKMKSGIDIESTD